MRQLVLAVALLVPLAVDTFAMAAALAVAGLGPQERRRVSAVFAAFEAGMPVAGVLVGGVAGRFIGAWAGYGGIAFLVLAGVLLLRADDDRESRLPALLAHARGLALLDLGLAISVDELTVGLSAGLLGLPLVVVVPWLGVQAYIATRAGFRIGGHLSEVARERSERAAGVVLLLVAGVLLAVRLLGL